MKRVTITTHGKLPADVQNLIKQIKDLPAKDAQFIFNKEIDFLVVDLQKYHGNCNQVTGWLHDGTKNTFGVTIEF